MKRPLIILASASPRRRELLSPFFKLKIIPADCDETQKRNESPRHYVARVAEDKWRAVAGRLKRRMIVVTADTTVILKNEVLGKPVNQKDAQRILKKLAGKAHHVVTAICVGTSDRRAPQYKKSVSTQVKFRKFSNDELKTYLQSGEWRDKAGAYAIQGKASTFIAEIRGSLTNVVGLPLEDCLQFIRVLISKS